jgi:DNA-binding NtrC family response regulator
MQRVAAIVERAAATSSTVLITGENGTGKELVARVLHAGGRRRHGPFVTVNCGAIPESLLETELFGILPNVATGVRARDGCFKLADGGTLLLDEIGEMPPRHQVALLSVLASREITPVGGGRPIPVDVRVIAATHQDLRRLIAENRFREDLFYRLSVLPIEVPPLRDHKADIPALARHFVRQFAEQQERPVPELTPEFMATLMQSDWPGNVRELQNYIERVLAMTPGSVLRPDPLPRDLEGRQAVGQGARRGKLADQVRVLERRLVAEALERAAGNVRRAARALGLSETAMRTRVRRHGLDAGGRAGTKRRR